ncbi:hypothetical protein CC86DRAFT_387449 [Ophiobolus disseminans]|uniref:Uncharacterized protein n=1 Tax=Ophiobolus disseminans TaxID=1469910 RepID=A0A6A6ZH23_9PLEO|nr:hypothetical protein CC86DRAFT_387449 [Ophiobolus disseminans]
MSSSSRVSSTVSIATSSSSATTPTLTPTPTPTPAACLYLNDPTCTPFIVTTESICSLRNNQCARGYKKLCDVTPGPDSTVIGTRRVLIGGTLFFEAVKYAYTRRCIVLSRLFIVAHYVCLSFCHAVRLSAHVSSV